MEYIKNFFDYLAGLDLSKILPLPNGLAGLSLLLACTLIGIALFKRRTSLLNGVLVLLFCLLSGSLVAAEHWSKTGDRLLTISAMELPSTAAFPIKISINGGIEWDLRAKRFESPITTPSTVIWINASTVADQLAEKERMVSELNKRLDAQKLPATLGEVPG
jgi:hypothetical protein